MTIARSCSTVRRRICFQRSRQAVRGLTSESTSGISNPQAFCRDFVRKHDYNSFLISHFYPKVLQNSYFAIKAFSVELATIQDTISNDVIGQMRMQFWRDALNQAAAGSPPKHPIALALYETSLTDRVSLYHLKRVIDARDAELQNPIYVTVDSLTAHAESTSSTIFYLLISLLHSSASDDLSHAASHLGAAQTFTTLLRALPFHAKNGRMVIPAEITSKHGVNQEEVFRKGHGAHGIDDAVFEFATLAHDHLNAARDMLHKAEGSGRVPKEAMPVFLAGVPVSSYLKRLENAGFDVFEPKLQLKDGWLPWRIWTSYYKKQI